VQWMAVPRVEADSLIPEFRFHQKIVDSTEFLLFVTLTLPLDSQRKGDTVFRDTIV
jgi:hypothetical protein